MGIKFSDVPKGLVAFSKGRLAGWLQIVAFCGLIENTGFTVTQRKSVGWRKDASMTSEKGEPGNFSPGWIGAFTGWPHRLRVGRFGAPHGLASQGV